VASAFLLAFTNIYEPIFSEAIKGRRLDENAPSLARLIELEQRSQAKHNILTKIQEIADGIISEDDRFQDIDKKLVLKDISEVLDGFTLDEMEIPKIKLADLVKSILLGYAASKIFDDLTPTQKQAFTSAAQRETRIKKI
jgi:hypothetical protein